MINPIQHYQTIEIQMPIERPTPRTFGRCSAFRRGQRERKAGEPCKSANGAYLEGWYSPEQIVPPYVTEAQMRAFHL